MLNSASQSGTTIPDYLLPLQESLKSAKNQSEQQSILGRAFGQSYFALFEIIDTPEVKNIITVTASGITSTGSIQ